MIDVTEKMAPPQPMDLLPKKEVCEIGCYHLLRCEIKLMAVIVK